MTGFHGTSTKSEESILKNGFDLSRKEDNWLGEGVYFFGDLADICDGFCEARDWAVKVRGFGEKWAVLECKIQAEKVFDLSRDRDARKKFDLLVELFYQLHLKANKKPEEFSGFEALALIELEDYDCFIAVTDGAKFSAVDFAITQVRRYVRRPQLQICVKDTKCIMEIQGKTK